MNSEPFDGQFPITPYGHLKEGDLFIRLGNYPVLLSDMKPNQGHRVGSKFHWNFNGKLVDIHKMVAIKTAQGEWLKEVCLPYEDDAEEYAIEKDMGLR